MAKSKNLAKTLMESINDCVLITDTRGVIQDINENGLALFGFKVCDKESLKGQHISAIFTPKKVRLIQKNLHKVSSKKQNVEFETEITTTPRKKLFISASFNYVKVGNKEILLLVFRDQSIFHTVNTMMDNYDEQYQTMIETCPCGLLVLKPTGEIIDVNQAYVKMSGYNWDHLVKMNYLDLLSINGFDKKEFINKNSKIYKIPHKTKDSQLLQVKTHVSYLGKNLIYIFVDNINKEIKLKNNIQQWKVQVDKILAGLQEREDVGIILADNTIGLTFANDFICEAFGYSKEELLKLNVHYLMDWRDQEENIDKYLSVLNGDVKKITMVAQFVRKDKSIFKANLNLTNHNGVVITEFENITYINDSIVNDKDTSLKKVVARFDGKSKGLLVFSPKEGISYANRTAFEAFGYGKDEMIGINHHRHFTHPDYLSKIARNTIAVYTGLKSKAEFPIRFTKKDGTFFAADLTVGKHKEGKVKYLILQFENVAHEVAS